MSELELSGQFVLRAGAAERVLVTGDVDGDGREDAAVVEEHGTAVRVLLADPGTPGLRGFRIRGAAVDDDVPVHAGAAGDVNGDGLADLLVPSAYTSTGSGGLHVVFGRRAPRDVNLARPEQRDLTLRGADGDTPVSAAGDVNGDGIGDLLLGPSEGYGEERRLDEPERAQAVVVFGARGLRGSVDPRRAPAGSLRLSTRMSEADLGTTVSGAGDVDGDGLGDVVLGFPFADAGPDPDQVLTAPGAAYIAYGRRESGTIDLDRPGNATRVGGRNGSLLGFTSAGVGDFNGDGLADVAIGAPIAGAGNSPLGTPDPPPSLGGEVAVIYGQASRPRFLESEALGEGGLIVLGPRRMGASGISLAPAGDVDSDGRADFLVGAPGVGFEEELWTAEGGSAHLVYGAPGGGVLKLGNPGDRALMLRGGGAESVGVSLAAGSDLDADGRRELLVARSGACRVGRVGGEGDVVAVEPGSAPRVFGAGRGTPGPDQMLSGPTGDSLWGFGGADTLSGSDGHECVLAGDSGDLVRGGRDGDVLFGEDGNDFVRGDSGPDKISGGAGDDAIIAGPDKLPRGLRERDGDRVGGGDGDDRIRGGSDPDRMTGGRGDDFVSGGPGNDDLAGDRSFDEEGDSVAFSGDGESAGADTLLGGGGRDNLEGGEGDDALSGGTGRDSLFGGDGRDRLSGGSGRDHLSGGGGADRIAGGAGHDRVFARDRSRDVIRCGAGRDVADVDRRDVVIGCERVRRR